MKRNIVYVVGLTYGFRSPRPSLLCNHQVDILYPAYLRNLPHTFLFYQFLCLEVWFSRPLSLNRPLQNRHFVTISTTFTLFLGVHFLHFPQLPQFASSILLWDGPACSFIGLSCPRCGSGSNEYGWMVVSHRHLCQPRSYVSDVSDSEELQAL